MKFEPKIAISVLTIVVVTSMMSCSKDRNKQTQLNIEDSIKSGSWKITKFVDSGKDETAHFTGYNLTFADGGTLTASNGSNAYSGTWSITDSNSKDDTQDDLDFNISFGSPADFEELSDDWDFISHSETKIELKDVSGGNGGTDYLTFEKN
jgi:hypothetical protein